MFFVIFKTTLKEVYILGEILLLFTILIYGLFIFINGFTIPVKSNEVVGGERGGSEKKKTKKEEN